MRLWSNTSCVGLTGPVSRVCATDAICPFRSNSGDCTFRIPSFWGATDEQYILKNCLIDGFAKSSNIKSDVERHVFGGNESKHEIIMQPMKVFQTYLYDKVRISTRDPNAPPDIDPNYLPDEHVKIIIKSVLPRKLSKPRHSGPSVGTCSKMSIQNVGITYSTARLIGCALTLYMLYARWWPLWITRGGGGGGGGRINRGGMQKL